LGLCPGTLQIHYFTHVAQKTEGGQHRSPVFTDLVVVVVVVVVVWCQVVVEVVLVVVMTTIIILMRWYHDRCDLQRPHPYGARVAARILYLNDEEDFDGGGQFYWADRSTSEPKTVVEPRIGGRFMVFTSGPENLRGALPVLSAANDENKHQKKKKKNEEDDPAGRLAFWPFGLLASMWYILSDDSSEVLEIAPEHGASTTTTTTILRRKRKDGYGRTELIRLPVTSMKHGGLQLALGLYLLGQQNKPSQGAWTLISDEQEGESKSS
jgi:hypothetical protein